MTDIICHDGQGYPLEFLSQWDINQVAVIRGIELSPVPCVRFSNKSSIVSLVVKPTVVGDSLHVDIPNVLLQQSSPIIICIYYEYDDSSGKIRHIFNIPVIPNKMPEDYIPTQNVEYVSWVEVRERAEEVLADLQNRPILIIDDVAPTDNDRLWLDTSEFPNQ